MWVLESVYCHILWLLWRPIINECLDAYEPASTMTCHISFEHHSNRICCQITQNAITPSEMPADSRSGKQIPMCAFPRQMLGKFQHGIPPMMTSPEFLARSVGPRTEPILIHGVMGRKKRKVVTPVAHFLRTFMSSSESYYPFSWESDE